MELKRIIINGMELNRCKQTNQNIQKRTFFVLTIFLCFFFCSSTQKTIRGSHSLKNMKGYASYYGKKFHNRRTANGERYDMYSMTAAHKYLPFNTKVQVTNLINKKSVIVRINDRGTFYNTRRIIDLSYGAAIQLDMIHKGVVPVVLEIIP